MGSNSQAFDLPPVRNSKASTLLCSSNRTKLDLSSKGKAATATLFLQTRCFALLLGCNLHCTASTATFPIATVVFVGHQRHQSQLLMSTLTTSLHSSSKPTSYCTLIYVWHSIERSLNCITMTNDCRRFAPHLFCWLIDYISSKAVLQGHLHCYRANRPSRHFDVSFLPLSSRLACLPDSAASEAWSVHARQVEELRSNNHGAPQNNKRGVTSLPNLKPFSGSHCRRAYQHINGRHDAFDLDLPQPSHARGTDAAFS